MKKYFIKINIAVLFFVSTIYSAEVYFSNDINSDIHLKNPKYSFAQRIKDLFDFTSKRDYSKRSGEISGQLNHETVWQNIGGDKTKTFLEEGIKNLTELNLKIKQKMCSSYHFEGNLFLRKTDNLQIETDNETKLKQFNIKLFNPKNMFEFGDFYNDFSPFVLGTSLEGFNFELTPKEKLKYKLIFARKNREDMFPESLIRYVVGTKTDFSFYENSDIFNDFRVGVQYCNIFDDKNTVDTTASEKNLQNMVYSIDGDISLIKTYSMQYEIAQSVYKFEDMDNKTDLAFRVQSNFNFNKLNLNYLFYQVNPNFYTDTGSAIRDKVQHQLICDYKLNDKININFTENYYWDKLPDSTKNKRTIGDEKYLSFILRPFKKKNVFTIKPYINYLIRDSDDLQNISDAKTVVTGIGINDSCNKTTFYGVSYEYRKFNTENNVLFEESSHRTAVSFSSELKLFNRGLNFSLNPFIDLRKNNNMTKEDVNLTINFNGQYQILSFVKMLFGHNFINSDNSVSGRDYVNNRSYLEFNSILNKKYSTKFVLRAEKNVYFPEDVIQNYDENKVAGKFITNF